MTNIVELKTPDQELRDNTIQLLETWIENAKKGEIVSVAIIGIVKDGFLRIQTSEHDSGDTPTLLAGSVTLQRILTDDLLGD